MLHNKYLILLCLPIRPVLIVSLSQSLHANFVILKYLNGNTCPFMKELWETRWPLNSGIFIVMVLLPILILHLTLVRPFVPSVSIAATWPTAVVLIVFVSGRATLLLIVRGWTSVVLTVTAHQLLPSTTNIPFVKIIREGIIFIRAYMSNHIRQTYELLLVRYLTHFLAVWPSLSSSTFKNLICMPDRLSMGI